MSREELWETIRPQLMALRHHKIEPAVVYIKASTTPSARRLLTGCDRGIDFTEDWRKCMADSRDRDEGWDLRQRDEIGRLGVLQD
jgi:hypothetical protein